MQQPNQTKSLLLPFAMLKKKLLLLLKKVLFSIKNQYYKFTLKSRVLFLTEGSKFLRSIIL